MAKGYGGFVGGKLAIEGIQGTSIDGELRDKISVQQVTVTDTWQEFTIYLDFPAITDLTPTVDSITWSAIKFWFSAGSDYSQNTNGLALQDGTCGLAMVRAYVGSSPRSVRRRTPEEELLLCRQYSNHVKITSRFYASGAGIFHSSEVLFGIPLIQTPSLQFEPVVGHNCSIHYYDFSKYGFRLELESDAAGDTYVLSSDIEVHAEI